MTETTETTTQEATETPEAEQIHVEGKWKLPRLDLHKLPGAASIGELLQNQMAHLKTLYQQWERLEGENKERLDHGIDEMARLAHHAVDASLDFVGKMRRNSLEFIDKSATKLRRPVH